MIKNGFRFLAKGLSSTLRGCNLTSKLPGNGKCVRQLESTYMDNVSDQRTYNLPHAHEYSIPTKKVQRSSFLPFVIKGSSCIDTCLLRSAIQNNMSLLRSWQMDNVNDPRTYNLTHVHEYSTPTKKVQRSNFLPFVIKGSSCIDTCLLRSAIQNNMSVVANKPHVSLSAYSFKNDNVNRMFPRSVTTKVDCLNINGMPFLGMDMGGTLTKLVFFEPNDSSTKRTENELLSNVTKYLMKNSTYGKYGHRDAHLQMDNVKICNRIGTLHFITFPTSEMNNFLDLCKKIGMADSVSTICATGGGAKKFKKMFENELNLKLRECDELASLIHGLIFSVTLNNNECYSWSQCTEHQQRLTQEYTFQNNIYPFIVVNIGTGVSILAVYGPNNYKRIFGTNIGGGMFLGLNIYMTKSNTFDEAIELAAKGDNYKVDKSVHDIYGYAYSKIGLPEKEIACSFAKLISKDKCSQVFAEDFARAALVAVSKNAAAFVRDYAHREKIDRICFVGNFLRGNTIATNILSEAMDYGSKKAIFLNHGGYCGAIGSMLSFDERFKNS